MRYGLQFADGDPFPKDVEFGIELEDETPIVVPDECPECPECPPAGNCEVECWGWNVLGFKATGAGGFPYTDVTQTFLGAAETLPYSTTYFDIEGDGEALNPHGLADRGNGVFASIVGNFCGHKVRYVVDAGDWVAHDTEYVVMNKNDGSPWGMAGVVIVFTGFGFTETGGTIKAQIDLTDAAEGEETWTDLCGSIRLVQSGV